MPNSDTSAGASTGMSPVRWGFLGAGRIATNALAPAVHASDVANLHSVAARDIERAEALEPTAHSYTSYDQVIESDDVEAVYISLTNEQHVPWAIKALEAGKHVLVEKPMGLSAGEVDALIEVADDMELECVEASWNRWHPRTQRAIELLRQGVIGDLTSVAAALCVPGPEAANYRYDPARGGGALYDLGPYALSALLWATRFAPVANIRVNTSMSDTGVDLEYKANCSLGNVRGELMVSLLGPYVDIFAARGELGTLKFPGNNAFLAKNTPAALQIVLPQPDGTEKKFVEKFDPCNPYELMVNSMSRLIRGEDEWVLSLNESLAISEATDLFLEKRRA